VASGRLAAVEPSAGTETVLYTRPGGSSINAVVSVCNRNTVDVEINISRCERDVTTSSDDDYLEYETILRPKGILERDIKLAGYQSLIIYSSHSNVTFQVGE